MTKQSLSDGAILVFLQIACLFALGREAALDGFPLDDAWIHQVIARNFAEQGSLGFAPGKFGSAATSMLWPVLLSTQYLVTGKSPALFSLALNFCFYFGAGLIVWRLLTDAKVGRIESLIGAFSFVASGNFVWFAFSGMEALLLVFLVLATIFVWDKGREEQRYFWAAILTIALVFTRMEAACIAALLSCHELSRERMSALPRVARYCGVVAMGVLGLLFLNMLLAGHPLPPTLEGRRWMWLLSLEGARPIDIVAIFPLRWVDRLSEFTLGTGTPEVFWAAAGVAFFGSRCLWQTKRHGLQLLLLFGAGHLCIYALLLPVEGHGGRYQPLTPALFSLSLCVGLMMFARALVSSASKNRVVIAASFAGAGLAVIFTIMQTTWEWGRFHALAVKHIDVSEVAMGHYVETLPQDARIASFDIGGIGYFGRKKLLDLGALSDPEILQALKAGTAFEYLKSRSVTHVIVPQGYNDSFSDPWNYLHILRLDGHVSSGELRTLHVTKSPQHVWAPGLRATLHSAPRQVIYSVSDIRK